MSVQATIKISDVPELLEKLRNERKFLDSLEQEQRVLVGRCCDPEVRRLLKSNRAEIDVIRGAITDIEQSINDALERRDTNRGTRNEIVTHHKAAGYDAEGA